MKENVIKEINTLINQRDNLQNRFANLNSLIEKDIKVRLIEGSFGRREEVILDSSEITFEIKEIIILEVLKNLDLKLQEIEVNINTLKNQIC